MIIWLFMIGCACGSFANVVALRMPNEEDFITTPSHCPHCQHRLEWYDLIPIVSWIHLQGRCRYCHQAIAVRYIIVEILCGSVLVYLFVRQQGSLIAVSADFILFLIGLIASMIDWQEQVIYPKLLIVAVLAAVCRGGMLGDDIINSSRVLSVIVAGVFYGSIYLVGRIIWKKEAFGSGDIYYLMMIACYFPVKETLLIANLAFIIGGFYCMGYSCWKRSLPVSIAFVPFIFAAEILVYSCGTAWIGW